MEIIWIGYEWLVSYLPSEEALRQPSFRKKAIGPWSFHKASTPAAQGRSGHSCTVLLKGPQALNASDCCTRFKRTSCAAWLATKFSAAAPPASYAICPWPSRMEAHMQLAPPPSQTATVSMPGITCCGCVSKLNKKPCHHAKVYRSVMARQMFDFALLLPYGLGSNRCFIRNQPTNTLSIPMASNASLNISLWIFAAPVHKASWASDVGICCSTRHLQNTSHKSSFNSCALPCLGFTHMVKGRGHTWIWALEAFLGRLSCSRVKSVFYEEPGMIKRWI